MERKDIEKLAELARLEITDEEKESFLHDMPAILSYVGQISEVNLEELEPEYPLRNVMREDENAHEAGLYTEAILKEMPDSQDGYLKVKQIL